MTKVEWIELAIAIVSGVAAVAAALAAGFAYMSVRATRDLVDIERERWTAEQQGAGRARLRAVAGFLRSSARASIINDGPADALDVTVIGVRKRDTGATLSHFDRPSRARLGPGDVLACQSSSAGATTNDPLLDVEVRWNDGAGTHQEWLAATWHGGV